MPKSSREILIEFNQRAGKGLRSCCFFKLTTGQICFRLLEERDGDSYVFSFYEEGKAAEQTVYWKQISENNEEEYRFNAPIEDIDLTNLFFWDTTACVWMRSFWQSDEQVWIDSEIQHGDIPIPNWRLEVERQGTPQDCAKPDLKLVGWWQSSDEPYYPHPKHLVDPQWRKDDRDRIAAYLKEGQYCGGEFGYSYCRFGCFHEENLKRERENAGNEDAFVCSEMSWMSTEMGSSVKTDGVWVWPEGLSHYVEHHDVRLPDEFVSTMEQKSWSPDPQVQVPRLIPEDTPYCWVTWALDFINSKKQGGSIG